MKINSILWGNPKKSDYNLILDYYSGTKINSIKTSSVPLAQYWKKPEKALNILSKYLNIPIENPDIYFEYPTKSFDKNRSSMSDIMIISDRIKIAVEAKYTEYKKMKYQTIKDWKKEGDFNNREQVINHWMKMITPFCEIESSFIDEIPYQFFHRTASVCNGKPENSVVVYQLFWDNETLKYLASFISDLKTYIKLISPKPNLQYLIHTIETFQEINCNKNEVFQLMKSKRIYRFGNEKLILA
jgi:hypothetical protein